MRNLFLILILFTSSLFAQKIYKYNIDIKLHQSGSLDITENIYYDFEGASKHGIFRDIPFTVKNGGLAKDLGFDNFRVKIDGRDGMWSKSIISGSDMGEMIRIKIGSPNFRITGKHLYTISYQVQKGILPSSISSDYDSLRWNVIGTGWRVPISDITTNIYLPPSISDTIVKSFKGLYGSIESSGEGKWIDNHHLQHKVAYLSAHEGITIEINYPQNILDISGKDVTKNTLMENIIISWHWPLFFGFILYLWSYFNKYRGFIDSRSIAVRYKIPKDINILQAGLIYDKFANNDDFSSAILELAQKGYIEITQKRKKANPILQKTNKNTSNLSKELKYLMDNTLFLGKTTYILKRHSSTESSRIESDFNTINNMLYSWSLNSGYMQENPEKRRKKFLNMAILWMTPIVIFAFYSISITLGADVAIIIAFSSIFIFTGLVVIIQKPNIPNIIFGTIFGLSGFLPILSEISIVELLSTPLMVVLLLFIAIYTTYLNLGAYTQKGAYLYKYLLGFKKFMSRVKSDEIKRRLEEDPLYLEKTLPYALLFGLNKHWIELFDKLNVPHPTWYHGSLHNITYLSSAIDKASSQPPSNGGGSSGGGGFSGGGGGGGGGGSW